MNLYRHTIREGERGIRSFLTLSNENRTYLDARFEGYIAAGAAHSGLALSTDDDTAGLQLFAGISHVACVWITGGSPTLASVVYRRWGKHLPDVNIASVRLHDRAIWWELWHDKWSWSSKTPRWRKGAFHWWDALTGKPVHTSIDDEPVEVLVPMPEGAYRATVTMSTGTWKRPRWPWPQTNRTYDLDVLSRPTPDGPVEVPGQSGYIPVPGKGENAWDCGGDGIFGQSGAARTVEEAIGHVVAGALRERQRHAGRHDYAEPI